MGNSSGDYIRTLKINEFQKNYQLYQINYLKNIHNNIRNLNSITESHLINNFKNLVEFLPFLSRNIVFGHEFERVVINRFIHEDKKNKRLLKYSQIKYPPETVAKNLSYNRANLPGKSVFYAGYGMLATALETKPILGDLYTTSKWRQKKNTPISYIPIFHNKELILSTREFLEDWNQYVALLGSLNKNVSIVIKELYNFITTVFITPVNPEYKKEYIFCSLFADLFMNDKNFGVDCIYYPSVPSKFASSNIALKPHILDSHFDLIEIDESVCIGSPNKSMRGWMFHNTATAIEIDTTKKNIKWKDETYFDDRVKNIIEHYNVEF